VFLLISIELFKSFEDQMMAIDSFKATKQHAARLKLEQKEGEVFSWTS
jgi:hypothetical protein